MSHNNVRKGISQAEITESGSKWLFGEMFVVSAILGLVTLNFLVFFACLVGFYFIMKFNKSRTILIYIFNSLWTIIGAFIGFLIGGSTAGILGAVLGVLLVGFLAFKIISNVHYAALVWYDDITVEQ